MARQESVGKALEAIPEAKTLISIVEQAADEVKLNPAHLVKVAATQIRLNPKLARCTPASFVGSLIVLEQVGLEPVAGRAYLLPFMNSRKIGNTWQKIPEVQAIIGYKGMADLFYRHESALTIEMHTRHKNDFFEYEYGTSGYIKHRPADFNRGDPIGYYCIAKMKNGGQLFLYMSKQECEEHGKKHSKVFNKKENKFMDNTPWVTDFDSMAKKTVLIQLSKSLPLSIETQKALSIDETSREYRAGVSNALDLPDTTSWEPEQEDAQISESPIPTLPQNVLSTINALQEKIGKGRMLSIIGSYGYERIDDIPNIEEANKIIREVSKVRAGS